ncbi:MAG: hypothetical protein ACOY90_10575 [Candidatus Zhuqueibacterota bacterium]
MSKSSKKNHTNTQEEHSELLLQAGRPNVYRTNAFRISGLAVDASPREIKQQMQKIEMQRKFGVGQTNVTEHVLAIEPPPELDTIRDAIQKLNDPETRLIHEFFWFWPHKLGDGKADPALQALSKNDVDAASQLWIRQENMESVANVSMHNLAVLSHVSALDLELALNSHKSTAEQQKQLKKHWQQAFQRWTLLIEHEAFWSRLNDRIRDLDDPRLTTGTGRRIRSTLPLALLLMPAELAIVAAEQGRIADSKRLIKIVHDSGFDAAVIDEALRMAVDPVRQRIKMLCKNADDQAKADPLVAHEVAIRCHQQTRPLLASLAEVLNADNSTLQAARDEVALQLLTC